MNQNDAFIPSAKPGPTKFSPDRTFLARAIALKHVFPVLLASLLLAACASAPVPPDWQANAFVALNSATAAYLEGNSRVADFEFNRVKAEIARTGRLDLMARAELVRCAAQVASLDFSACTGYVALATDALPAEQHYAAFLAGRWAQLKSELLPLPYRGLVAQALDHGQATASASAATSTAAPSNSQLGQIKDPLARLIATAVLLKTERITPVDIGLAVDLASNQGWRRPLLAWLGVQLKRAQTAGDASAAASLQRRIDLVLQSPMR
jgi:hypothetical protein